MSEVFELFQNIGVEFNPPLGQERVERLSEVIQAPVDPKILDFYTRCDGMRYTRSLPVRFMSLAEIEETNIAFFGDVGFPNRDFRVFWTDDESNYVGYFLQGILQGKLCRVHHDENEFSPAFRSLGSFLQKVVAASCANQSLYCMPRDYPKIEPSTNPDFDLEDHRMALACVANYEGTADEYPKQFWGMSALNLLSRYDLDLVVRFTESVDMYVQEKACKLLGCWKVEDAIPLLAGVVRSGMGNGRGASLAALGEIGTPQARDELFKIAREIEPGFRVYVAFALENCGVKMQRSGNTWQFRFSETEDWQSL